MRDGVLRSPIEEEVAAARAQYSAGGVLALVSARTAFEDRQSVLRMCRIGTQTQTQVETSRGVFDARRPRYWDCRGFKIG